MRVLLSIGLLAVACPAVAQEPWLYAPMVTACFERAQADGGPDSCIGDAAQACMDGEEGGHTTLGMSDCMAAEANEWDILLNEEYQRARGFAHEMDAADQQHFPEYAKRAEQLLAAQRAWIAFRDAECSLQYGVWGAGSMRLIAGADCSMRMTAERTIALRAYRDPMR